MKFKYFTSYLDFTDTGEYLELREGFSRFVSNRGSFKIGDGFFETFLLNSSNKAHCLCVECLKGLECIPLSSRLDRNFIRSNFEGGYSNKYIELFIDTVNRKCGREFFPVILAVEHFVSLAGMKYVLSNYGKRGAVVVFDAHLDIFEPWQRAELRGVEYPGNKIKIGVHSGNFLKYALKIINKTGSYLWLVGAQEYFSDDMPDKFKEIVRKFSQRGLVIINREQFDKDPEHLLNDLSNRADKVYISFDADVCAGEYTSAVRFGNYIGIKEQALFQFIETFKELEKRSKLHLAGMDICEIFPPLTVVEEDRTLSLWKKVLDKMLN